MIGPMYSFFFASRRRHTRCALVTGVQTCALPISGERPRARATPNATGWTARAGARPRSLAEVEFRQRPGHRLQPEYRAYGGAHGVGIHDDDAALAYGRHLLGDGIGQIGRAHV